ncbi:MAG TPA: translation elongation factor Ts [Candidatus Marinimicrobia bacterium]|jgi:elongation factor Ts|nr:translation elongation factor Ts [Candidatus Neomarinimicrobiota bacterium]MDP7483517.1 translation elongation factor Ts [Candidatus Neomarinimicrobiota bacterium]MDP7528094.1 translation elongation factor Ts [Candidatus Neomarinimicrobiota bacterium]MDP7716052.1 translation elongation factor Ts [Candidatus Neomarinimicrobiota bacterium]HJL84400.1 translation elongation factor Ts [Candidatus Neomarinimicrobiota bacterium]|tara:strand:+ start:272 stop:892 length:621 start_codon:yes stop_codon:yes gene_type:complete
MTIDASIVKDLRSRTGAGIMDCKEALLDSDGNVEKAVDFLRKKGIAKAEKKVGREADQGVVLSYIHPGNRIGVLVEVNCETDFVAKTDGFQSFVKNIAMQIAATNPLSVTRDGIDSVVVDKEKEIFTEQAKLSGKPDNVLEKIIEGKIEKFYQESCLLEQSFIKDSDKFVQDILMETIATLGENISITRFSRFEVGDALSSNGQAE